MINRLNNKWIILAIILTASIIPFLNIMGNVFAYDDVDFFLYWEGIKHLNISAFFAGDLPMNHIHVYRPIRSIIQSIFYQFAGTNVWLYHILAITIHFINTFLIYLITKKITKQSIALMSAIFFAVLPVHVASITFMTASFDMIGIIFMLSSFLLYIKFKEGHRKKYLYFSLLLAILAYFSYELTIILPLLIILYHICFREATKKILWRNIKYYGGGYFLGAVALFIVRYFVLKSIYRGSFVTNIDFVPRILTASKIFIKYIYLTIINAPLSAHHQIDIALKMDVKVFGSIVLILTLIGLAFYSYKKGQKLYTFIIAWFFITMLPVSNIIQVSSLFDERYLYLASYAWALLLAIIVYLTYFYLRNRGGIYIALSLALIIVTTYGYLTWQRNKVWQTEETLWQDVLTKYPSNIKAYNNLGFYYGVQGDKEKSEEYYKKAIEVNENYSVAHAGLAGYAMEDGDYEKAVEYLKQAIEINPNKADYFNDLGLAYSNLKQWEKAKENYKKAIEIYPAFFESTFNLAVIYIQEENFIESLKYFQRATELKPDDIESIFGTGMSYIGQDNKAEGERYLRKALLIDPEFPPAIEVLDQLNQ